MRLGERSCWIKFDRADEHRTTLRAYVKEAFSPPAKRVVFGVRSWEVGVGKWRHLHRNELYVSREPRVRSELIRVSVLLGDVANSLRSSLEHLAFDLATA